MRDLPNGWTIGAELEVSDSQRDTPLPGRSVWDRRDYTIVNSNGVANDPKGETWRFGGEINTEPSTTIDDQINICCDIFDTLSPEPVANYRSNLHVHLRVPGLAQDVELVKRAINYVHTFGARAFEQVDPLPPKPTAYTEEGEAALVRWRRRQRSHHTLLSAGQMAAIGRATTPTEIWHAHFPHNKAGQPQRHLMQRAGVSFISLWDAPSETVEFRHFCLTLDLDQIRAAMTWCAAFLSAALDGEQALPAVTGRYPWQPLYDHWLETRYRASSRRYHTTETVLAVIERWRQEGSLDHEGARALHRQSVAQSNAGSLF